MINLIYKTLNLIPKTIAKIEKLYSYSILNSHSGVKLHSDLRIGKATTFEFDDDTKFEIGKNVIWRDHNAIRIRNGGHLIFGNNVDLSHYISINCLDKIELGDDTCIAEGCKFYDHDHAFDTKPEYVWHKNKFNTAPIIIGKNVKIYSNVTVLKGVTIGDNCIIGANCVISRNVPANSIIFGKHELMRLPLM